MAEQVRLRVLRTIQETADACSFVLEPVDTELTYRPGQFLTVRVPSERTGSVARSYSLSSSPVRPDPLTITVKRTAGGYASNWLCDHVAKGDVLEVLRPGGVFTPGSLDDDLLLVAAGSGITPVMSILKSCLWGGRARVTLIYANRDENAVIYAGELQALQRQYAERLTVLHWLESVQGVPSAAALGAIASPYATREAYVCGPGPFMDLVVDALTELGAAASRIHVERFVSLTSDPFNPSVAADDASDAAADDRPAGTVEITLDGQTRRLAWPRSRPLLDVLLDAGLAAPYSCREGSCSACACVVLAGEVKMRRNDVLEAQDIADGIVLGCQALPMSEHVRVSYDE
ncbi:ferredoxin--NADP reductase [Streptomyces soliscabiei]|uniref:ferredoxin--NADP reductase n=1 Tax=Streptomyces soliscabiei TaxID=588897 RepID=UPI0029B44D30|nr:ferredoxin--NADP reductase [Streptomyces sp. NY05-11A]MDX2676679.1 ferredoxin--NADP reductase [Streptomyces sp. NY05-11A]